MTERHPASPQITPMQPNDWEQVRTIYLQGIAGGHATFETDAPDWAGWNSRFLPHPRLVARRETLVLGWAVLSPVSSRRVYAGVAEYSLYIRNGYDGQGIGSLLLAALIAAAEDAEIWTIQGTIFPENYASLALVAKHGFRTVGRRERIGLMLHGPLAGVWRDVILVERRSPRIA
jgi:L-amino acid N-acyltransferase YncA